MTPFIPAGMRPVGVYPAAPRVVYKTERKNLGHAARVERIDRTETLLPFRAFSKAFNAFTPRPAPELGAYLHNRGFLPDKAALFGLPCDEVDAYLSDFQAAVLPLTNGRYGDAGENRLLLWQLHRGVLPLAPLAAVRHAGHLVRHAGQAAAGDAPLLSRPLLTGDGPGGTISTETPEDSGPDAIFLHLPAAPEQVLRVAVLHDSATNLPVILAATLLEGAPDRIDQPGAEIGCRRIDIDTGVPGPLRRFVRGAAAPAETDGAARAMVPIWWQAVAALLSGMRRLPVWAAIQFDLVATADGIRIIDITNRFDVAALQLDGPIMGSELATRFLRRYGL